MSKSNRERKPPSTKECVRITVIFMLIDQSVTVSLSLISIEMYLFFGLKHPHCRKCCDDDNDDHITVL